MKVKINMGCSGPVGSYTVGQTPTLKDEIGQDLINAGYAELLDAEAQPVEPKPDPENPPAKPNAGDGVAAKLAVALAAADEVAKKLVVALADVAAAIKRAELAEAKVADLESQLNEAKELGEPKPSSDPEAQNAAGEPDEPKVPETDAGKKPVGKGATKG